jgi:hypothetical protein
MPKRALSQSWITSYYEAISEISEAPQQFNIWAAISVISAVLKDHVYFSRGVYTIQPNQYIILVAPPGVGKGSAILPAYEFPSELKLINMISDRVTAPKIVEKLAKGFGALQMPAVLQTNAQLNGTAPIATNEAAAVIRATELQTLLGSSDWMTTFLCETWDRRDFEYDTKNAGTSIVKNMCLSLIGACVPSYIQNLSREATSAVNGGFTARAVFVYANKKSQDIVWPKPFDSVQKGQGAVLRKKLNDDLLAISQLRGEFSITDTAKTVFQNFYRSSAVSHSDTDSDVMLNFKSRIHVHAFKVAMALSAAAKDTLVIDYTDMVVATTLVKQVQSNLDKAFRGLGSSILAEATNRVQAFIEARGLTTRKEILKYNHRYVVTEDLERILYLLVEIGVIEVKSSSTGAVVKYIGDVKETLIANPMASNTFNPP